MNKMCGPGMSRAGNPLRGALGITWMVRIRGEDVDGRDGPHGADCPSAHRWMYWTDWEEDPKDSRRGRLERAWMDGSHRDIFVTSKTVLWPNGLSLDIPAGRLYWVDAFYDRIETILLNGTDRKVGQCVPVCSDLRALGVDEDLCVNVRVSMCVSWPVCFVCTYLCLYGCLHQWAFVQTTCHVV